MNRYLKRRLWSLLFFFFIAVSGVFLNPNFWVPSRDAPQKIGNFNAQEVISELEKLEVKGRAPKTGYSRERFGRDWAKHKEDGCDMRNKVLKRDLKDTQENSKCQIIRGILNDPYTSKEIIFIRSENSSAVQIDHVVALSDAWQKGAQNLTQTELVELANDPLNLIAVDGAINQQKGDSDAASWLPPNKDFRCQYIKRQISVKRKYNLWVTEAEKIAMKSVLLKC